MTAAPIEVLRILDERPDIPSKDLGEMFQKTTRTANNWKKKWRESQGLSEPAVKVTPSTIPAQAVKPAAKRTAAPKAVAAPTQTFGARAVVWSGLLLGLGFSVAANVSSAEAGIGPKLAAGFAPLATLLALEAMIRPKWFRKGRMIAFARYVGLSVVAGVAAVVSYGHQRHLLLTFGESELSASILPLAADGLIVITATALLAMKPEVNK